MEKNKILDEFGVDYASIPAMFRKGSSVFRDKVKKKIFPPSALHIIQRSAHQFWSYEPQIEEEAGKTFTNVRVDYCDVIGKEFWDQHPDILVEN